MSDKTCTFQQVGVLVYTWRVPEHLDGDTTYRLKLSTRISNEEHLSGPLRVGIARNMGVDGSKSRMTAIFGIVCFLFVLLVFSRWLLRFFRKRRRGYIRMGWRDVRVWCRCSFPTNHWDGDTMDTENRGAVDGREEKGRMRSQHSERWQGGYDTFAA